MNVKFSAEYNFTFQISSTAARQTSKKRLSISLTLFSSMGLTWIFGYIMLISPDPTFLTVFSWIFAITNTTQVIVITLLFNRDAFQNQIHQWRRGLTLIDGFTLEIAINAVSFNSWITSPNLQVQFFA